MAPVRTAIALPGLYTLNVFNTLTSIQLQALDELYTEYRGGIPPRKVLVEVSKKIGLPQTRIRRWLEERSTDGEDGVDRVCKSVHDRMNKLQELIIRVEERITQISTLISSL